MINRLKLPGQDRPSSRKTTGRSKRPETGTKILKIRAQRNQSILNQLVTQILDIELNIMIFSDRARFI